MHASKQFIGLFLLSLFLFVWSESTLASKKPIIYLANNYGFSPSSALLLVQFKTILEHLGYEVWEPFSRHPEKIRNPYEEARKNIEDLKRSDLVFVILNGESPDPGVMFELGFAASLGKTRVFFRDDCRSSAESHDMPFNLMTVALLSEKEFKTGFYQKVSELENPRKTLRIFYQQFMKENHALR